ncbi:MAG: hypothetical protein HKN47_13015 [Pirellulaceae bacterium]|nr:hypothetical protein [Pirellulaceae bacterium]
MNQPRTTGDLDSVIRRNNMGQSVDQSRQPRWLRLALCILACWTSILSDPSRVHGQEPSAAPMQWAIIAADDRSRPVAELLTVELSSSRDIALVERDQIQLTLDELQLNASGLVKPEEATEFGKFSQANALVLVHPTEAVKPRKPQTRVRLIDTRTSVRLLDIVLPSSSLDQEVTAVADELHAASQTLAIPSERLRLISIVPIVSGEPGHFLKPYCRTLTALVAAEFHRRPEFVVLEREDLQRLTTESGLSGIELKLRGATRILETSVRRDSDGKGVVATCQIGIPGGALDRFEINVPSLDPVEARLPIADGVIRHAGSELRTQQSIDPELEAQTLDRRRRWLRDEEAVAMGEAALALAPTQERLQGAVGAYASLLYAKHRAKEGLEALLVDRRRSELQLRSLHSYPPEFPERTLFPLYYTYASRPDIKTDEERRLFAEVSNLRREILQVQLRHTIDSPRDRIDTLLRAIDLELNWATDTPQPVRVVAGYLEEAFRWIDGTIPRTVSDPWYNELVRSLFVTIKRVATAPPNDRWHVNDFDGWMDRLANTDNRFVLAGRLWVQTRDDGADGERAAQNLLTLLHALPLVDSKYVDLPLRDAALSGVNDTQVFDYFVRMLDRIEQESDPSEILVFGRDVAKYLNRLTAEQSQQIARRMVGMLNVEPEPGKMLTGVSMLVTLSKYLPKSESPFAPPPEFSLDDAPGPWQDYRVVPIRLTDVPRKHWLQAIHVQPDSRPGNAPSQLVVAWSRADNSSVIDRIAIDGGTPTRFGPVIDGIRRYVPTRMAVTDQRVFVTQRDAPLLMITTDAVTELTEKSGAASNQFSDIAWCNGRLYIAYQDAFGSYDPVHQRFELLASASSVRPQNPLDARGSFLIRKLLADESQACLWMIVQDRAAPHARLGLWRFDPQDKRFQKISDSHVDISLGDGGILLHRNAASKLAWVDSETSTVTELPQFSHAAGSRDVPNPEFISPYTDSYQLDYPRPHLIKVGDHVISSQGTLFTADGKSYSLPLRFPWLHLKRCGEGFITHYEPGRRTIWYVQPK